MVKFTEILEKKEEKDLGVIAVDKDYYKEPLSDEEMEERLTTDEEFPAHDEILNKFTNKLNQEIEDLESQINQIKRLAKELKLDIDKEFDKKKNDTDAFMENLGVVICKVSTLKDVREWLTQST